MNTVNLIFFTLLGTVVGSFLNLVIDRLPEKESIVSPPSHCDSCGKRLSASELIPVISYLLLKGRCRKCDHQIPLRNLFIELGTGLVYLLIWIRFGISWETLLVTIYSSLLITITGIDLEHQKIPNLLIYPAIALALAMIPILYINDLWMTLAGGALGFGVLFLLAVLAPGSMGMGDVKLVLFLGLILGYPEIVLALFLAFVSGGLISGILLALKRIGRKDTVAFGPYLALGGFMTLLYGSEIIDWWLRSISR
jgi:leader peptidase (prepilin peptidase)/N-methyltransferase